MLEDEMFRRGQLFVCIDDSDAEIEPHPVKGCIYTLRGMNKACPGCGSRGFWFEEIVLPKSRLAYCNECDAAGLRGLWRRGDELAWAIRYFRPVQTNSIKSLEALLLPSPAPQKQKPAPAEAGAGVARTIPS